MKNNQNNTNPTLYIHSSDSPDIDNSVGPMLITWLEVPYYIPEKQIDKYITEKNEQLIKSGSKERYMRDYVSGYLSLYHDNIDWYHTVDMEIKNDNTKADMSRVQT